MSKLLICLLFIGLAAKAQVSPDMPDSTHHSSHTSHLSPLYRSYDVLKESDPWLTAPNTAALTRYHAPNAAQATVTLTKAKGAFTNFNGSPDVLQADAAVESFFRLNSRTVVYGLMSYDNFSGKDMAGSAFISDFRFLSSDDRPQASDFRHLPFDIVEDSLNNTGTKHRDTYRLKGGFGCNVFGGLSVGASLDYTAANYAKYKDLRHKNKLMDITFTAGAYLPLGGFAQIGANYLYRRTTESLAFSTYGKGGRNYMSLVNYGPYIGQVEQFGSTGYTDKSREMPLVDDCDGFGVQLSFSPLSTLLFYNAFTYAHRRGYYGRRSPYTILFTRHHSNVYHYDARLSHQSEQMRAYADLILNVENLENQSRIRREIENETGASHYEYYTPVKTGNRLWVDGRASLSVEWQPLSAPLTTAGSMAAWTLQGGVNWAHHKQTAYLFPYYRRQKYTTYEPFVSLSRNIATKHGVWTAHIGTSFRHGDGTAADDGTFIEPSDRQTPPPTMDTYLWREYQWMNAAQYEVDAMVQYSFIMPATKLKTFVRASASHRKCNERNEYTAGPDRTTAALTIGCEF